MTEGESRLVSLINTSLITADLDQLSIKRALTDARAFPIASCFDSVTITPETLKCWRSKPYGETITLRKPNDVVQSVMRTWNYCEIRLTLWTRFVFNVRIYSKVNYGGNVRCLFLFIHSLLLLLSCNLFFVCQSAIIFKTIYMIFVANIVAT